MGNFLQNLVSGAGNFIGGNGGSPLDNLKNQFITRPVNQLGNVARGVVADVNLLDGGASHSNMYPQQRLQQQALSNAGFQNQLQQQAFQRQQSAILGQRFKAGQLSQPSYDAGMNALLSRGNVLNNSTFIDPTLVANPIKDNNIQAFTNNAGANLVKLLSPQGMAANSAGLIGRLSNNQGLTNYANRNSGALDSLAQYQQVNAANKYAAGAGNMAGTILAGALAPEGKLGTAVNVAKFGLPAFQSTAKAIQDVGGTKGQQLAGGSISGIVQGAAGALTSKSLLGGIGKGAATRALVAGASGALDNSLQTLADNAIAQKTYDPNRKYTDNLKSSALTGFALPFVARGALDVVGSKGAKELGASIGQKAPQVAKAARATGNSMAGNAPIVLQLKETVKQYQQKLDNTQSASAKKAISGQIASLNAQISAIKEGGYIKVPGGKNDPAPDLHPEQKTFINDYANMLEGMDSNKNGGMLVPDGEAYGSGKKQLSTHTPFYSDTYAATGSAPTKLQWFDEARKQIESGKAAFGASGDYAQLPTKQAVALMTPTIKKAEDNYANGKISGAQLENIRNIEAKAIQTTAPTNTPANPHTRMFEYTDNGPMTAGEKKAYAALESNRGATDYQAAANEVRQLSKESGQPELYKKVMDTISSKNMSQTEATQFLSDSLKQMRDTGTIAKIKGFNAEAKATAPTAPKLVDPQVIPKEAPIPKAAKPIEPVKPPISKPVVDPPSINTKEYVKQQTKLQETAAKGEKVSLPARLREEIAVKGIDALSPIEKPVEKALGGRDNNVALRNQLDRSLKSDTIGGQFVKDNGFDKVVQKVPDTKAFDQYLLAKHGADLEANGIKTGRNSLKDAALVKQLGPQYEAHAKAITDYNNKLLDKTVEYGLISKNTATYLKQKYPNYVPFDRIFSDTEMQAMHKGNGSGPASLSTQDVVQRIKGSDRQVHSPLESILKKTGDVHALGERNLAAKAVADTRNIEGNPLQLRELKAGETIGNKSTISYLDNGVKRTFETTPEVAQAAKSLNKQQLGLVGKILSYPTRVLRLGATGANVAFTMANVVKDVGSSFINSKHPIQSLANPKTFMESLYASVHHGGKEYSELVREGAGGTSFDIGRNSVPETLAKIRADRSIPTKIAYTVRHPSELLKAVEDTIGRSEEFGRAEQYFGNKRAKLKEGATPAEARAYAADAARNNTTNFARAGEYGRVLNSVLPYFNAGLQGSRTLMRNMRDNPAQTGAKIAISAFLPVAATTAWALSDPKRKEAYDDIPDYEKQGNIIIVPPNPKKDANGRWNVIKIPVSQEIANLNSTVRNGIEALKKDKGFDFAAMAGDLTGTATSLNTGSPRQLANQVIPQGLKPGIEALTNKNLFTGNTIVSDTQKNLQAKDQYSKGTSGTAKILGGALNLSPSQLDNAYRTATGGLGQNILNASDTILSKLGAIQPSDVKGVPLATGIRNRFYTANGTSDYQKADKAAGLLIGQLQATDGYKNLSQDEKRKAVNRLQNDAFNANFNQLAPKPDSKTSARQQGLLDGTTKIDSYLTPSTGGSKVKLNGSISPVSKDMLTKYTAMDTAAKNKYFNSSNDAEYKYQQAKYENDLANGTLSKAQAARSQYGLTTAKIGAGYSKETRDLYALSKQELYGVLTTDPNGKAMADKILQYGDELKAAGGTNKFRDSKGNVSFTAAKSTTGAKKASTSKATYKSSLTSAISRAATTNLSKFKVSSRGFSSKVRSPSISAFKKVATTKVSTRKRSLSI